MEPIDTFERNGFRVHLHVDTDGWDGNPRHHDNTWTLISWDPRKVLLDQQIGNPWHHHVSVLSVDRELRETCRPALIVPLRIDRDSIPQWLASDTEILDGTYQPGWALANAFAYVTRETLRRAYSCQTVTPAIKRLALDLLRAEIDEYCLWVNGEVFGYVIEDRWGETVDSCWGFLGLDYTRQTACAIADALDPDDEQPDYFDVAAAI